MKIKQTDRVLEYMRTYGGITQLEAMRDLGVMRLASRISDLKKSGYCIRKSMVASKNRWGEPTYFAKYSIMEG